MNKDLIRKAVLEVLEVEMVNYLDWEDCMGLVNKFVAGLITDKIMERVEFYEQQKELPDELPESPSPFRFG